MKNKEIIILVVILSILILVGGGILIYKLVLPKPEPRIEEKEEIIVEQAKEVQIFNGTERPIAVMIDNHSKAWPQANINQAYLVYEIIVEGGETRLMALFKGKDLKQIGPIRSSRHYFLDYALENDAIYVHYGWSPQAESDVSKLNVNNINGLVESSKSFWRVKGKSSPHDVMTSTEKIKEIAKRKKYSTTSEKESILNYSADAVELAEGAIDASTITIPHSDLQKVEYKYNTETQRYTRYARNKVQTDYETKEEITTKNIIITFCENYTLTDSENKGRQGLKNIGTFDGYYITNGKAIKIKCTKSARNLATVYKDLQGNEINVNDGNTFINICSSNAEVSIQ